jgi:putative transposase
MPTRNTRKQYAAEQVYHIYSRGVDKQPIFRNDDDYGYFVSLLARYLSKQPATSKSRVKYSWYGNRVDLYAYCLMSNHIHLLLYQFDKKAMTELTHSLMTSYSMYFNKKYQRVGPVFQSRYLASPIDKQNYFDHISRYIHLNPKNWDTYEFSSINYYLEGNSPEWLNPNPILSLFKHSQKSYRKFVSDYEQHKQMLDEIKYELAHE